MKFITIAELDKALEDAPGNDKRWWMVMNPATENLMRQKHQNWLSQNPTIFHPVDPMRMFYRNVWITPNIPVNEVHLCTIEEMNELMKDDKEWQEYQDRQYKEWTDSQTRGW
jgi:hypothetical protein